jgi:hypothetical protein
VRIALAFTLAAVAGLSGCRCGNDAPTPKTAVQAPRAEAPARPPPPEDGADADRPVPRSGVGGAHGPKKQEQSAVRFYAQTLAALATPELQPAIRQGFEKNAPAARVEVVTACEQAGRDAATCEAFAREIEAAPQQFVRWVNPGAAGEP